MKTPKRQWDPEVYTPFLQRVEIRLEKGKGSLGFWRKGKLWKGDWEIQVDKSCVVRFVIQTQVLLSDNTQVPSGVCFLFQDKKGQLDKCNFPSQKGILCPAFGQKEQGPRAPLVFAVSWLTTSAQNNPNAILHIRHILGWHNLTPFTKSYPSKRKVNLDGQAGRGWAPGSDWELNLSAAE